MIPAPVEPRKTDVARIADLPPLLEGSYDDYNADDESDKSSDLGGADGTPLVRVKQTEFFLKLFARMMGQADYAACNKWKKVWMAGFLKEKHQFHYPWAEPSEIAQRWIAALGHSGSRFFGDIWELAAVG